MPCHARARIFSWPNIQALEFNDYFIVLDTRQMKKNAAHVLICIARCI